MSEKAPELKPCPFCGAPEPRLAWIGNYQFAVCDGCGARTTKMPRGQAAKAWNMRPDIAWLQPELVERLRRIHSMDSWELLNKLRDDILAALEAGRDAQ